MNEQERDLILGLTAGDLSSAEAAEARALIDANPGLARELAIQMDIRDALVSLRDISMTASERSELRSRVRGALNLDSPERAVLEPARRRVSWWQPLFGLAAAAAIVTAIVVLPSGLGGTDAQDSAFESDTTVASADSRDDGGGQDVPEAGTFSDPESVDPEQAGEVQAFTDVDGSDLLTLTEGAATAKDVDERLEGTVASTPSNVDVDLAEACLETIGSSLPRGDKILLGVGDREGTEVAYFAVIDETGVSSVLTIDLATCTVVAIDD